MSRLKVDSAWRKIVADENMAAKKRAHALAQMLRPSISLLRKLLSAKDTPKVVRLLATELYAVACTRRELLRHEQTGA
jgi:hypothetical protein